MIPSVKLDFSHVKSKCGSLDKLQHAAGGGNVSDLAENHLIQDLSFLITLHIKMCVSRPRGVCSSSLAVSCVSETKTFTIV